METLRAVTYSRVSTHEQVTRIESGFNSLDAQTEQLRKYCDDRGYSIVAELRDDGHSSSTIDRPDLKKALAMAGAEKIDLLLAVRYDRIGGGEAYPYVEQWLEQQGVRIETIHDPIDPRTAAGKSYIRNQISQKQSQCEWTGENVRRNGRWRARRGEYLNGPAPFGFVKIPQSNYLANDPKIAPIVRSMFEVYVRTRSDAQVRKWLRDHQIPTSQGRPIWSLGSVRSVLTNARHKGVIELGRRNKGRHDVLPEAAYEVVEANSLGTTSFAANVETDLWDLAFKIRQEQASKAPRPARPVKSKTGQSILPDDIFPQLGQNKMGRGSTRTVSQCKSGHPFVLQGLLFCAECGHPLSPDYTEKKPNAKEGRKKHAFVNYYECTMTQKYGKGAGHAVVAVLATRAERWALAEISKRLADPLLKSDIIQEAKAQAQQALNPIRTDLRVNRVAQKKNAESLGHLKAAMGGRGIDSDLREFMAQEFQTLRRADKALKEEFKSLEAKLEIATQGFDTAALEAALNDFETFKCHATSDDLRSILQLMVRDIRCSATQVISVRYNRLFLPEEVFPDSIERRADKTLVWKSRSKTLKMTGSTNASGIKASGTNVGRTSTGSTTAGRASAGRSRIDRLNIRKPERRSKLVKAQK